MLWRLDVPLALWRGLNRAPQAMSWSRVCGVWSPKRRLGLLLVGEELVKGGGRREGGKEQRGRTSDDDDDDDNDDPGLGPACLPGRGDCG